MFLLAYFLSGWKTAIILCLILLVGFFLFYKFLLLIVFFPLVGSCTRVSGDKIRCKVSSRQTRWDSHRESDRALSSFNPVPPLYTKEQASMCTLCEFFSFLQQSLSSTGFQSSWKILLLSVRSQGWGAQYVLWTHHSSGRLSKPSYSLLLLWTLLGECITVSSPLFPSYPTQCGSFFTALIAEDFPPVSSLFLVRNAPRVDLFFMCL